MSAETNGAVNAQPKATSVEELRRKRHRVGVMYVALSDDLTVGISQISVAGLVAQERIPSPLLRMVLEGQDEVGDGKKLTPQQFVNSIEFMDAMCAAVIVDPPYTPIKQAGLGAVPEGSLTMEDLTDEEKGGVFAFVYGGLENLEKFRRESKSSVDIPPGPIIEGEAVVVGVSDRASLGEVLAGRGGVGEGMALTAARGAVSEPPPESLPAERSFAGDRQQPDRRSAVENPPA